MSSAVAHALAHIPNLTFEIVVTLVALRGTLSLSPLFLSFDYLVWFSHAQGEYLRTRRPTQTSSRTLHTTNDS